MQRMVLDTDVIVAAMHRPTGASAALLRAALDRRITMLASVPLFFEYEAKCTVPVHWTAAGLTREQADAEKISAMETGKFFTERARQADLAGFRKLLERPGGESPQPGDELE